MKIKSQRSLAVWALVISLCVTTIAYAALSTTLKISGSITKKGGTWDIKFTDVAWYAGEPLTTTPSTSGTSLSFAVTLSKPMDYTIIKFKITNSGSLPATLRSGSLTVGSDTKSVVTAAGSEINWSNAPEDNSVRCILSSDSDTPRLDYINGGLYDDAAIFNNYTISSNRSTGYVYLKCLYKRPDYESDLFATDATVNVTLSMIYFQA